MSGSFSARPRRSPFGVALLRSHSGSLQSEKISRSHALVLGWNDYRMRNIEVKWFQSFEEIKGYLLTRIPNDASVGIGNSQTLHSFGITEALLKTGNAVYDKELGKTRKEIRGLKRKALLSDYYISGANAVSMDGRIVNIDHSGNRVAALAYGPDKVFIVVGKNKKTATCEEAVQRARRTAAPLNAKRAGYQPPCIVAGHCVDCLSAERVCNIVSIIEGQLVKGRIVLLIAGENAGY